jgi:hypothetical protein
MWKSRLLKESAVTVAKFVQCNIPILNRDNIYETVTSDGHTWEIAGKLPLVPPRDAAIRRTGDLRCAPDTEEIPPRKIDGQPQYVPGQQGSKELA